MIKFEKISKVYPSRVKPEPIIALEDISFEVSSGEFLSIVGKSGAGKTTLIKLLIGEEIPTEGSIFFDQENITQRDFKRIQELRKKIGVVYQDYRLLASRTVFENIAYILEVMGYDDDTIRDNVEKILDMVNLEDRRKNFPEELSGGEQQRLAIARALIHKPHLLIADEPTGNLDPYNTFEVIELFRRINNLGTTVVLATHDKKIVDNLNKRVIILEQGRMIQDRLNGKFRL
jgi:cell division transport system ATP-binding protein